jgi:cytochrome P450
MGSLERRLESLEGRQGPPPESPEHREARARMRACLDEIAAARREGREPSEEAVAVMKAFERRIAARES